VKFAKKFKHDAGFQHVRQGPGKSVRTRGSRGAPLIWFPLTEDDQGRPRWGKEEGPRGKPSCGAKENSVLGTGGRRPAPGEQKKTDVSVGRASAAEARLFRMTATSAGKGQFSLLTTSPRGKGVLPPGKGNAGDLGKGDG